MANVTLKNTAAGGSLANVSLSVSYFVQQGEQVVPRTDHYPAGQGTIDVAFPVELKLERDAFFAVLLGGTLTLSQRTVPAKVAADAAMVIEFEHSPIVLDESSAEETPPPRVFVYGRLLDKAGKARMEDIQIIIAATRPGATSPEPIAAVQTEASGYFFFDYPAGVFTSATALVGMRITENPVPIRLEEVIVDAEPTTLVFPRRIVLVVELVADATTPEPGGKDDCGCGALDMHDTKRVLEEYSFFTLVRTTEPEVQGYVLAEDDDLTLDDVLTAHPLRGDAIVDTLIQLPVFSRRTFRARTAPSLGTAAPAAAAVSDDFGAALKEIKLSRSVVNGFINREHGITKDNIVKLIELNESMLFKKRLFPPPPKPLGRVVLDSDTNVDWDKDPTLFQAVSVAHGHLLHFKSEWIADGYSLGDLLYSLPLAPGQKKQIVVFDWERRESASNVQSVDFEEGLSSSLGRDRDVFEITKGAIAEHTTGSSSATTASASAGVGGFLGGLLFGVSGGVGHAQSNATQDSLRQTSASDLQKIRDRIVQSANAVRSQRSSVIQTVSQGERFEISSETVANYNHCHAVTIQYFEVLRHFKVRQRFAEARECVFVPLVMSQFDLDKLLRWNESLQASLIDRRLATAFSAAQRVKNQWADSNFPSGTFASERILSATGNLQVRFILRRPADKLVEMDDHDRPIYSPGGFGSPPQLVGYHKKVVEDFDEATWQSLIPFLGSTTPREFYEQYLRNAKNKDDIFHRQLGEKIATAFVDSLTFHISDETGNEIASVGFDATLASRYRREGTLNVSLHFAGPSAFARDRLHYLSFRTGNDSLPEFSTVSIESGFMRYRSRHYEGFLFNYKSIKDDLGAGDGVTLFAGPTADELRDPRKDDLAAVNRLMDHINDNLEYYHKAMWLRLSPERRFLLLDGIVLPPGSKGQGRSLASLVENDLLGVVGNSLVFPVARGLNLDPNFTVGELTEFYMVSPSDPMSVSVPTKGVYAEAMMGSCNSCEEKDESRFWRWEESPIPDSPTAINPISTDSRRADPGNLQPAAMPNPILNIQNAPAAPDPTGLAATLALLGKGDSFRDVTGLAQNQTNALESLKASFDTTKSFGQEAAKIELQRMQEATKLETQKLMDRRLDTVMNKIKSSGLPADKQADLTEKAINAFLGAGATKEEKPKTDQEKAEGAKAKTKVIKDAVDEGVITPEVGKDLARTSLQHALFAASEEGTPGTIEAQELLDSEGLAGKDFEFENAAFRIATKSADGGGGGSGSGAGPGTGSGSGGGTPPAPPALDVTFVMINYAFLARHGVDPVNDVTVNIAAQPLSATNHTGNRVTLDLSSLPDGTYTVEVLPTHSYQGGDYNTIGDPTTAPPDRIWMERTTTITKVGNTFTSTDPLVTIAGRTITIRMRPVWMQIAANGSRHGTVANTIIVHHTDDLKRPQPPYDPNFHSHIGNSLNAWRGSGTAPHYVIDRDGWVIKLGHEQFTASHAGVANWDGVATMNRSSIGIEIVHTNNVDTTGADPRPTYTEDFTNDQYSSLVSLLTNLQVSWTIPIYNIIGHSDIATNAAGRLGRKSSDPGRQFDWQLVEAAGLGLLRDPAAINWAAAYGGFFDAHPGSSIQNGGAGVTAAIITELKDDLRRIGYSVTTNANYDASVQYCIMVFCEHFLATDGQTRVTQAIAEVIKKVRAYIDTVKP